MPSGVPQKSAMRPTFSSYSSKKIGTIQTPCCFCWWCKNNRNWLRRKRWDIQDMGIYVGTFHLTWANPRGRLHESRWVNETEDLMKVPHVKDLGVTRSKDFNPSKQWARSANKDGEELFRLRSTAFCNEPVVFKPRVVRASLRAALTEGQNCFEKIKNWAPNCWLLNCTNASKEDLTTRAFALLKVGYTWWSNWGAQNRGEHFREKKHEELFTLLLGTIKRRHGLKLQLSRVRFRVRDWFFTIRVVSF